MLSVSAGSEASQDRHILRGRGLSSTRQVLGTLESKQPWELETALQREA